MTEEKLDMVAGLATTARMAVDLHGEFYMVYPQYFDIAAQWHGHVPNATTGGTTTTAPQLFLDFGILPFGRGKQMDLTISEMRIVMTLWCLLRSPLIFGGAVVGSNAVDPHIFSTVTNTDMLRITDDVQQPTLLPSQHDHIVSWMALSGSDPATTRYVAVFNLGQKLRTEDTQAALSGPKSPSCVGTNFRNDTCFHNPRGKLLGTTVKDATSCCEACGNYSKSRCVAWSVFNDHGSLKCFLFGSIGKVNHVKGCISAGGPNPAPAPAPFSGELVSLSALQLDDTQSWEATSVWDPGRVVIPIKNGSFVSRPSYHDVSMYVVSSRKN